MGAESTLSPQAGASMRQYIELVCHALRRGGAPESEVQSVAQDVQAQIEEMLAQKLGDRMATADDVQDVIAGMPTPESYGDNAQPPVTTELVAEGGKTAAAGPNVVPIVFGGLAILAGCITLIELGPFAVLLMLVGGLLIVAGIKRTVLRPYLIVSAVVLCVLILVLILV